MLTAHLLQSAWNKMSLVQSLNRRKYGKQYIKTIHDILSKHTE